MGENSKIPWTDHTFNPWVGCAKISPACDNCYAEIWAKRAGRSHLWEGSVPERTTNANWRQPLKWNREAEKSGIRRRVFCASLADVFDGRVPFGWLDDLWILIRETPWLDWLILTKRPEAIPVLFPSDLWFGKETQNVCLGVTAENQREADHRIPFVRHMPMVKSFVSCEPLLENINLDLSGVDWVICGGESGADARMMDVMWAVRLLNQCREAGVPFFMKQMGAVYDRIARDCGEVPDAEWGYIPQALRVREFPREEKPF